MRKQPDLLERVADAPAQLVRLALAHVAAVDEHRARVRLDQPVHQLQRRRLPAARRAHQEQTLAARHLERDAVHRERRAVALHEALEPDHAPESTPAYARP